MVDNDIKEILSNAFRINTEIKFKVGFNSVDGWIYKNMTYLELGIYLSSNHETIIEVNILQKL